MQFCPQSLIDDDGWADKDENKRQYLSLKNDSRKKVLETLAPSGLQLLGLDTKYFVLDTVAERLLYLVDFERGQFQGKSTVCQVRVWRDRSDTRTKGLAERIFFDYLAPSAELIVTDGRHTKDGQAFWQLRIAEAFERSLPVFLLDHDGGTLTACDKTSYTALVRKYYGWKKQFRAKRIAIGRAP